ncbi:MAG TPA: RNA-binding protein [Armatimonadota bacterium]|nr:RNA-binding protein [Armatimonadota bacterium]
MSKRLFVGNLSFDISEAQLQEAFAAFGSSGATIPLHDNGKPKGFGFVDVAEDQAEAAITALDGKDMGGRNVAVSEAKPRVDAMAQGNRGGRGGGGGRGGYGGGGGGGGRDRDRGGRGGGRW